MNRLTVNDLNRTCYDPWELCGMDSYCTKDCHEKGGCTKGCEILKMYKKLAEYEDLEDQCIKETTWSLRMFLKKWNEFFEDIQELYEYRKLEEQGMLLKLPCAGQLLKELCEEKQKRRWIPVEEQMPDAGHVVLAYIKHNYMDDGWRAYRVYEYTDHWVGMGNLCDVVAWMPLPDPYRPEETE